MKQVRLVQPMCNLRYAFAALVNAMCTDYLHIYIACTRSCSWFITTSPPLRSHPVPACSHSVLTFLTTYARVPHSIPTSPMPPPALPSAPHCPARQMPCPHWCPGQLLTGPTPPPSSCRLHSHNISAACQSCATRNADAQSPWRHVLACVQVGLDFAA